jgi:nitrite reductase/ring-hydroxylating ferredoxin subunit
VLASAYLGGALSYNLKIGVNHAPVPEELPEDWKEAIAESDLNEGEPKGVKVGDVAVMLLRRGGAIAAIAAACSHLGGPLPEGKIEGDTVVCPWHGSRFCLKDGSVINGPATTNQPMFQVKVDGGTVFLKAG